MNFYDEGKLENEQKNKEENIDGDSARDANYQPSNKFTVDSLDKNQKNFPLHPKKTLHSTGALIQKTQEEIKDSIDEPIQSINDSNYSLLNELIEEDTPSFSCKTHSRCINELLYEIQWAEKRSSQFSTELLALASEAPRNNERLLQIYEKFLQLGKYLKSKEQLFIKEAPTALKKLQLKIHQALQNIENML